jgi:Rrf2 family protein
MRVLAQEEYGLRCLLRVAELTDAGPAPLSEIASAEGLSPEYAGRLLQRLRQAGFLDAARGPGGGYRLARPATGITVRSVIEVFDDPIWSDGFCSCHTGREAACVRSFDCSIRALWRSVGQAVSSVLDGLTLEDLLHHEPEVQGLLQISKMSRGN